MAKQKKKHVHTFSLFRTGGQRVIACSGCGERSLGNGKIDLKKAINVYTSEDS